MTIILFVCIERCTRQAPVLLEVIGLHFLHSLHIRRATNGLFKRVRSTSIHIRNTVQDHQASILVFAPICDLDSPIEFCQTSRSLSSIPVCLSLIVYRTARVLTLAQLRGSTSKSFAMHRSNRPSPLKLDPQLSSMQQSTSEDQVSKVEHESNIIQQIMSVPSRNANNSPQRHMGVARAQSPMKVTKSQSQRHRRDDSLPGRSVAVSDDSRRVPNHGATNTSYRQLYAADSVIERCLRDDSMSGALDEAPGRALSRNAANTQPRHVLVARSQSQRNMTSVPSRNADNAQHRHMDLAGGQTQRHVRDCSLPGIFAALGEDSAPPRPKTMFGPYGMLDRPTTEVEAIQPQVKENTGLKKWADKIKGAAGELKADLKSMAEELRDVAGELVNGLPAQTRKRGDRDVDDYGSAQLITSMIGPNVRHINVNDGFHAQSSGIIGLPLLHPPTRPASPTKRPLPKISLAPPIQARLFSELELVLTKTINDYLLGEKVMGRMSDASVEKIVKSWMAKGRPLPNEFYFDLATQLELFHANLNTFRFYGEHQGSYLHIQSMLNGWSNLAKRLNRRTLSTPDSEIKKYMVDIDNIFVFLGADQEVWEKFGYWRDITLKALSGKAREEEVHGSRPLGVPMASMPPGGGPEEEFDDQDIVATGLRLLGHRDD